MPACNSMGIDPVIQEYSFGGDLFGNISRCIRHTSKSKSVTWSLCIHLSFDGLSFTQWKSKFSSFINNCLQKRLKEQCCVTSVYYWAPAGWFCTPSGDHFQNCTRTFPLKKVYFLLPQLVNAENQAVGAIRLPTSERMRCERDTWSYWRAITGIQDHKACLLLISEFPIGSNKKQIFIT